MRDISVAYKNVDGLHVFTSPDVTGFYVASMNPREAFEEVGEGLALLLHLNEGIDVDIQSSMDVEVFLNLIGANDARDA